jgi:histidinol-phosphate aminotransferase
MTVERVMRLDLNTVPRLNEAALRAAWADVSLDRLAQYPGRERLQLRRAIARRLGLHVDQVLLGHGSDELLDLAIRAFVPFGGTAVGLEPSFSMYPKLLRAHGGVFRGIPFGRRLPWRRLGATPGDVTLIASPNNPTGTSFARTSLRRLAEICDRPLLLDEAYAEFAGPGQIELLRDCPNLLLFRTFSKAYGLPGIRIGYALGSPRLLRRLERIQSPYSVSTFGVVAALSAWRRPGYFRRQVREARRERHWLSRELRRLDWPVWPSSANFLLVGPIPGSAGLVRRLASAGIRVRCLPKLGQPPRDYLRITLGTRAQNRRLISQLGRPRR